MGRYSVDTSLQNPNTNQTPNSVSDWPKTFLKETIGINRNGVIVKTDKPIMGVEDVEIVPGCLEAIKMMRLKGYKVFLFFNEPMISQGKVTTTEVDATNQKLMEIFGQAGIFSIEGLLYSTTNSKEDIFSLPNTGMLKKAEREFKVKFKGGYFVGNKITDLKVADSVGSKPILINSGDYEETKSKLNTFANRDLKNKTKEFASLLSFANSLN